MRVIDEKPHVFAAYEYDRTFHALKGTRLVYPEHAASGETVYRLPAFSTLVDPPDEPEGKKAVFLESTQTWILVADHRGETWFDWAGRPVPIERLGDPREWGLKFTMMARPQSR